MTKTQKIVIEGMRAIGGECWLGNGIKDGSVVDYHSFVENIEKLHGKRESNKLKKMTGKGVWCSSITLLRLQKMGEIEPVDGLPGRWRIRR